MDPAQPDCFFSLNFDGSTYWDKLVVSTAFDFDDLPLQRLTFFLLVWGSWPLRHMECQVLMWKHLHLVCTGTRKRRLTLKLPTSLTWVTISPLWHLWLPEIRRDFLFSPLPMVPPPPFTQLCVCCDEEIFRLCRNWGSVGECIPTSRYAWSGWLYSLHSGRTCPRCTVECRSLFWYDRKVVFCNGWLKFETPPYVKFTSTLFFTLSKTSMVGLKSIELHWSVVEKWFERLGFYSVFWWKSCTLW